MTTEFKRRRTVFSCFVTKIVARSPGNTSMKNLEFMKLCSSCFEVFVYVFSLITVNKGMIHNQTISQPDGFLLNRWQHWLTIKCLKLM